MRREWGIIGFLKVCIWSSLFLSKWVDIVKKFLKKEGFECEGSKENGV